MKTSFLLSDISPINGIERYLIPIKGANLTVSRKNFLIESLSKLLLNIFPFIKK